MVEVGGLCSDDAEGFRRALVHAIRAQSRAELTAVLSAFEDASLVCDTMDEGHLRALLDVMASPVFRRMADGWVLLRIFERMSDQLSTVQRSSIMSALLELYEGADAWMLRFTISEMIADLAEPEDALAFLLAFRERVDPEMRRFVPHGLTHVVQSSPCSEVAKRAVRCVQEMLDDQHPDVRLEAKEALRLLFGPDGMETTR